MKRLIVLVMLMALVMVNGSWNLTHGQQKKIAELPRGTESHRRYGRPGQTPVATIANCFFL